MNDDESNTDRVLCRECQKGFEKDTVGMVDGSNGPIPCARCGEPGTYICRLPITEDEIGRMLHDELEQGDKCALALVDHVLRIGAGGCQIPVLDRPLECVVIVMSRQEWEEKFLRPGDPNPFLI